MQTLFQNIAQAHRRGESLVLCTVIERFGSAPRGSGAMMAVFSDGTTAGTIGGGAVEYETIRCAISALSDGIAQSKTFLLTPNDAADIGMICGGSVTVRISPILGTDASFSALLDRLLPQLSRRTDSHLLLLMGSDSDRFSLLMDGAPLPNDVRLPDVLPPHPALYKDDPQSTAAFLLPLTFAQTVYVFGGGHVAAELVPLLTRVDFSVIVYEDRAEFCNAARFPTAHGTILGSFSEVSSHVSVTDRDFLVIMTRGHQADYEVLRQALRTPARYIGVIGSRKKVAATRERLLTDGFTQSDLSRIHSPIGLPILAETPAEIAVSIAAEMIAERGRTRKA